MSYSTGSESDAAVLIDRAKEDINKGRRKQAKRNLDEASDILKPCSTPYADRLRLDIERLRKADG